MFGRLLSKSGYGNLTNRDCCDVLIVGGGIIGLATARELLIRHPGIRAKVLEKESQLATHQSRHNSGVIHAGIYYPAGSYKARLCKEGMTESYAYFDRKQIPYKKCGKLIVALEVCELSVLEGLMKNATLNGIPGVRMITHDEMITIEPYCQGLRAIYSPHTGIVNWERVAVAYGDDFVGLGGKIQTGFEVTEIRRAAEDLDYPLIVKGTLRKATEKRTAELQCKYLIACTGLHSDRVAKMSGCSPEPKIVPFRGDFLLLKPEKHYLVRGNIYPVPDPTYPFLGVHLNPSMDNQIWLGPNAVLALKREGYGPFDFNLKEALELFTYPGLLHFGLRNLGFGLNEWLRSLSIRRQVKPLQRFIPSISTENVIRGPSGIRAQAMDRRGSLVDDFVLDPGKGRGGWRVLHVRCVPSPGATSSLPIARHIVNEAEKQFDLPGRRT